MVLLGYTKQHTRDVYAVAVARNQTEQNGESTLSLPDACPGSPGQARTPFSRST